LTYVKNLCQNRRLQLTVVNRETHKFPNAVYPRFMEMFEYYINIKQARYFDKELNKWTVTKGFDSDMSLNSLQALSLGMKVIHWENVEGDYYSDKGRPVVLKKFPEEHDSLNVVAQWKRIYERLLE